MKKNIDKDAVSSFEGFFNPELLFCNDATVVDYLNALLESEPALNMDFREIHFVHQEIIPNSKANTIVGNAMLFDAEFSKTEVNELRSENENLKFKTELAEIDAQVLRSENNKLKIEKERLVAQLVEMREKLNTIQVENASLIQNAKTVLHQVAPPAVNIEEQAENVLVDSNHCAEKPVDERIDYEPEQTVECEIPEQELQPKQELQPESELQPEPAKVVEECRNDDRQCIPVEQERLILSGVTTRSDSEKKSSRSDVTIFSRENTTGAISRQSAQTVSRVIKQHPAEINHNRQTEHILKVASPDVVPSDNNEADNRLIFVQQHHVAEIENSQEAEATASIAVAEPLKDVDEIDMPPAADPKVIIRRNVKNYEDLQKESDSKNTTEAVHTIIL